MPVSKNNQAHKDKQDFRNKNQQQKQQMANTQFQSRPVGIQFSSASAAGGERSENYIWDVLPAGTLLGHSKRKDWWEITREWGRAEAGDHSSSSQPSSLNPSSTSAIKYFTNSFSAPTSQWFLLLWLDTD